MARAREAALGFIDPAHRPWLCKLRAVLVLPQCSALSSGEMGRHPLLLSSYVTGSEEAVLAGWDHLVTIARAEHN